MQVKLQPASFEYRHPRVWIAVRGGSAIWLVVLASILCAYGYWWGALLYPAAALHLWFAYRLAQS